MTELKTKHRGEPALNFLRAPDLPERIDAAIKDGSIGNIMESAKFLAVLISVGENSDYWKKELSVTPDDLRLLQKLTEIDGGSLDIFGQKTLKVLIDTIISQSMIFVDRIFPEDHNKPIISKDSIYEYSNRTAPRVSGEPDEFGIYEKGQPYDSVLTRYLHEYKDFIKKNKNTNAPLPLFEKALIGNDVLALDLDAISGNYEMFTVRPLKALMDSPKAFSIISKQAFAQRYIDAVEQPKALGMFVLMAITTAYSIRTKSTEYPENKEVYDQQSPLIDRLCGMGSSFRGNFLLSAKEFTINEFASNPLTVDELKAIPYLLGFHKEVYAEVKHNHGVHAQACAAKMRAAGHDVVADAIELNNPDKAVKPVRKHDDLSPGM
jgi:hypothetical protein